MSKIVKKQFESNSQLIMYFSIRHIAYVKDRKKTI